MTDAFQNDLDHAKKQVEAWKKEIMLKELSDDFYYTNGGYRNDSEQLRYWENKVKELSNQNTKEVTMEKTFKVQSRFLNALNEAIQKITLESNGVVIQQPLLEADGQFTSVIKASTNFDPNKVNTNVSVTTDASEKAKEEKQELVDQAKDAISKTLETNDALQDILNKIKNLNDKNEDYTWKVNEEDNTAILRNKNARIFKQNDNICLSMNNKVELFKTVEELHDFLKKNHMPLPQGIAIHEATKAEFGNKWNKFIFGDKKTDLTLDDVKKNITGLEKQLSTPLVQHQVEAFEQRLNRWVEQKTAEYTELYKQAEKEIESLQKDRKEIKAQQNALLASDITDEAKLEELEAEYEKNEEKIKAGLEKQESTSAQSRLYGQLLDSLRRSLTTLNPKERHPENFKVHINEKILKFIYTIKTAKDELEAEIQTDEEKITAGKEKLKEKDTAIKNFTKDHNLSEEELNYLKSFKKYKAKTQLVEEEFDKNLIGFETVFEAEENVNEKRDTAKTISAKVKELEDELKTIDINTLEAYDIIKELNVTKKQKEKADDELKDAKEYVDAQKRYYLTDDKKNRDMAKERAYANYTSKIKEINKLKASLNKQIQENEDFKKKTKAFAKLFVDKRSTEARVTKAENAIIAAKSKVNAYETFLNNAQEGKSPLINQLREFAREASELGKEFVASRIDKRQELKDLRDKQVFVGKDEQAPLSQTQQTLVKAMQDKKDKTAEVEGLKTKLYSLQRELTNAPEDKVEEIKQNIKDTEDKLADEMQNLAKLISDTYAASDAYNDPAHPNELTKRWMQQLKRPGKMNKYDYRAGLRQDADDPKEVIVQVKHPREEQKESMDEINQITDMWYLLYNNKSDENLYLNSEWEEGNLLTNNLSTAAVFLSKEAAEQGAKIVMLRRKTDAGFTPIFEGDMEECGTTCAGLGTAVKYVGRPLKEEDDLEETAGYEGTPFEKDKKAFANAEKAAYGMLKLLDQGGYYANNYAKSVDDLGAMHFVEWEPDAALAQRIRNQAQSFLDRTQMQRGGSQQWSGRGSIKGRDFSDEDKAKIARLTPLHRFEWQKDGEAYIYNAEDLKRRIEAFNASFGTEEGEGYKFAKSYNPEAKPFPTMDPDLPLKDFLDTKNPSRIAYLADAYPALFNTYVLKTQRTTNMANKRGLQRLADDPEGQIAKAERATQNRINTIYQEFLDYATEVEEHPYADNETMQWLFNKTAELKNDKQVWKAVLTKISNELKKLDTDMDESDFEDIDIGSTVEASVNGLLSALSESTRFGKAARKLFNESLSLMEVDTPEDFARGMQKAVAGDIGADAPVDLDTPETASEPEIPNVDIGNEGPGMSNAPIGNLNINVPEMGEYGPEGSDEEGALPPVPQEEFKIVDVLANTNDESEVMVKIQNVKTGETELKPLSEIDV